MEKVQVLKVLEDQHNAIDRLMAMVIDRDGRLMNAGLLEHKDCFMPTKSGPIWEAYSDGHSAIARIKAGAEVEP